MKTSLFVYNSDWTFPQCMVDSSLLSLPAYNIGHIDKYFNENRFYESKPVPGLPWAIHSEKFAATGKYFRRA